MKYIPKIMAMVGLVSFFVSIACAQEAPFDGLNLDLGNLSRISDAQSRSNSPENLTGEKGKGGLATEGTGKQGPGIWAKDGKFLHPCALALIRHSTWLISLGRVHSANLDAPFAAGPNSTVHSSHVVG